MSVLTLRPSADISGIQTAGGASGQGTTWDPYVASAYNGGGNGWATIDDAVSQPTAPDITDYIQFGQSTATTALLDLSTGTIPAGETVTGATLWVFYRNTNGSSRTHTFELRRADNSVLATFTVTTGTTATAWYPVTYTGSLTQTEVDGLRVAFTASNTFDSATVYAAYVDVVSSIPSVGRTTGTATFTRALRTDGKITETITSSGTWYAPPGVTSVDVQAWGGGGGSGTSSLAQGGGGGGAAYAGGTVSVNPSSSVTITLGAAGAVSNAGGTTSFGSSVIAAGGASGAGSGIGTGAGGAGGTTAASTGTVKFAGGTGATGGAGGGSAGGGGAGGAASANVGGAAGITATGQANPGAVGGAGGTSPGGTGGTPGAGGGSSSTLNTSGPGGPGSVVVVYTETGNNNSAVSLYENEVIAVQAIVTTVVTPTDADALSDESINATIATLTGSLSISETQLQILVSTITSGLEAVAEAAAVNSIALPTSAETLAVDQTNTTVTTITDFESIADQGSNLSVTTLTLNDALSEAQMINSVATMLASESLAERTDLITITALTALEALAQTQTINSIATPTQSESISEMQTLLSSAFLTMADALAQTDSLNTVSTLTANWRRIAPGLSGVSYNATGSSIIAGAEILVFRDDNNTVVASLVSDASGIWGVALDPALTYWVSYWSAQGAGEADNLFARTNKNLVPVESTVETGT